MRDNFGFVPLTDGLCLGIVLFSYAGQLCWGFTCEWDLVPDLHDFVLDVDASFKELQRAGASAGDTTTEKQPSAASKPKRPRTRKGRSGTNGSTRHIEH